MLRKNGGALLSVCALSLSKGGLQERLLACRVARAGIEPATFHFSGERYYRLSYLAWSR